MDRRLTRLYVRNVRSRSNSKDSKTLFSEAGKLSLYELQDGHGFLEYENADDASSAIKTFGGFKFGGEQIHIEYAMKSTNQFVKRRKPHTDDGREKDMEDRRCFKCKEKGHVAKKCPNSQRSRSRSKSKSVSRSRSRSYSKTNHHRSKKSSHSKKLRKQYKSRSRSKSPRRIRG